MSKIYTHYLITRLAAPIDWDAFDAIVESVVAQRAVFQWLVLVDVDIPQREALKINNLRKILTPLWTCERTYLAALQKWLNDRFDPGIVTTVVDRPISPSYVRKIQERHDPFLDFHFIRGETLSLVESKVGFQSVMFAPEDISKWVVRSV